MRFIGCILIHILLVIVPIKAQDTFKTESISVFKNGQSFVRKTGKVSTNKGKYILNELPNALFGTFWFSSKNGKITQVVSKLDTIKNTLNNKAKTITDLLNANLNQKVKIFTYGENQFEGIIQEFDLSKPDPYLLISSDKSGWHAIKKSDIKSISFENKPDFDLYLKKDSIQPQIHINFESNGSKQLEVLYLQEGIRWTPTYLLELNSDSKGKLRLQAEVINGLETIKDVEMNFVVGVPNFTYATQPATLAQLPSLIAYSQNYGFSSGFRNESPLLSQSFSNASFSNSSYSADGYIVTERDFGYNVDQPEVNSNNELYFYQLNNVSLEKGGAAHFPIFETDIDIEHFYEAYLPKTDLSDFYLGQATGYTFDEKITPVYHTIQLLNSTNLPFTTAAILMIDGNTRKPVAQSLLNYTPAAIKSYIKVTKAPDIRLKERESLVDVNKQKIKKHNRYDYQLATFKTEILIKNTKKKKVKFLLKKEIQGKLKSSNQPHNKTSKAVQNQLSPNELIEFEINLKAGEKKRVTIEYESYLRV